MEDANVGTGDVSDDTSSQVAEETADSGSAAENQTQADTPEETPEKAKTTDGEEAEEGKIPYDRFKQVNDEKRALEARVKDLGEKAEKFDRMQSDPSYAEGVASTGAKRDPVIEQADSQLKEMGYVKGDEVSQLVDQKVNEQIEASRVAEKFLSLESQYDGSDGGPKFEANDMFDHMTNDGTLGSVDPEVAYQVRYKDELADIRAKESKSTPHSEAKGQSERTVGKDRDSMLAEAKKSGDFSELMKDTALFRGFTKYKKGE